MRYVKFAWTALRWALLPVRLVLSFLPWPMKILLVFSLSIVASFPLLPSKALPRCGATVTRPDCVSEREAHVKRAKRIAPAASAAQK
ncbi:hypothetical protein [Burkholderia cenocepacia]|uniref:hypothetical protein n=1 Tax=Burkholderia cenocepacia TaxID=95486 RepID=UPI000F56A31B|nr:hypothetical protein [Burkholderia cenocepacia]RQU97792.1 hypothetical protein DF042_27120 [Burkholderia cenocepacia]